MEMDPFLRGLLFTDGTVTRTLEVKTLSRVAVSVVGQAEAPLPAEAADHLCATPETPAVRRRVVIGPAQEDAAPAIWAESHILPERLPEEFLGVLNDSRDGIGGSLQRVELESWREMLWFGLDSPPEWSFVAPRAPSPVLTRLYRVITGGKPALLISESFAVERRDDSYRLRWPARPQAEPNSSSIS
jgi:chorismate-pyruvate lyase